MNLHCPTCRRFLAESTGPNCGSFRVVCPTCRASVTFEHIAGGVFTAKVTQKSERVRKEQKRRGA